MAKARRRTSKPVADHLATEGTRAVDAPAPTTTTVPEPAAQETPHGELPPTVPTQTEPFVERREKPQEPASRLDVAPGANTRIEKALENVPGVVRGSEIEPPSEAEHTHHEHKRAGVYRDSKHGIRIDKETERKVGQNALRVLVSFREKPSDEERQLLKDEGFRFDDGDWTKPLSAANVELAKRTVNRVLQGRGDDFQMLV